MLQGLQTGTCTVVPTKSDSDVILCLQFLSKILTCILPQNALRHDCNGKCIEIIEGRYLEVVVLLYIPLELTRTDISLVY